MRPRWRATTPPPGSRFTDPEYARVAALPEGVQRSAAKDARRKRRRASSGRRPELDALTLRQTRRIQLSPQRLHFLDQVDGQRRELGIGVERPLERQQASRADDLRRWRSGARRRSRRCTRAHRTRCARRSSAGSHATGAGELVDRKRDVLRAARRSEGFVPVHRSRSHRSPRIERDLARHGFEQLARLVRGGGSTSSRSQVEVAGRVARKPLSLEAQPRPVVRARRDADLAAVPAGVATSMRAPSIASHGATGTVCVTSRPSHAIARIGREPDLEIQVARRTAVEPRAPWPASRICWPSRTPFGICTCAACARPLTTRPDVVESRRAQRDRALAAVIASAKIDRRSRRADPRRACGAHLAALAPAGRDARAPRPNRLAKKSLKSSPCAPSLENSNPASQSGGGSKSLPAAWRWLSASYAARFSGSESTA